ncbi:hypothetical protein JFL02_09505 [Enterococcus faecium]|nr:hypothetical protein [Enterococcus faecium]
MNVIDLPVHFRGTNYFYASNLIQKKMSKDERKILANFYLVLKIEQNVFSERRIVWEKQNQRLRRKNDVWNKRQSRMERLRKKKKATPFEIAAQYYSTIRGGVCEISLVKRLPRTR